MRAKSVVAILVGVLLGSSLLGCASESDMIARFVRYTTLQDGTRVAVVVPVVEGGGEEQTAFTSLSNLESGELVRVHVTGRSWETPQWMPEREIVAREPSR